MKNTFIVTLLCSTLYLGAQTDSTDHPAPPMNDLYDSLSYFLGLSLGYELQSPPFEANKDLILEGFVSAFQEKAAVDQPTARREFQDLQMTLQELEAQKAGLEAQAALEEASSFLEENGKREGVVTTPSGLQYEVLVPGDGPYPADTSEVEVHYHGTLIDGTVFDSSMDRGEPVTFPSPRHRLRFRTPRFPRLAPFRPPRA